MISENFGRLVRNGLFAAALVTTGAVSGASIAPQPAKAFVGVQVGGVRVGVGRAGVWRRGYGWRRGYAVHRRWRHCRLGRCW